MDKSDAPRTDGSLSRRRFLRHAAVAAWASPFIVTMMSRAAGAYTIGGRPCGTKIDGAGTTDCHVTVPCGVTAAIGCKGSPAGPAGSDCFCV